jgi:hypothetical protein
MDQQISCKITVNLDTGAHGSAGTTLSIQTKTFDQILSILGLRDEDAFSSLLDLKAKEVVQLTNSCSSQIPASFLQRTHGQESLR